MALPQNHQVQEMVRLLLELETPKPDDSRRHIAVAICHLQSAYLHRLLIEE